MSGIESFRERLKKIEGVVGVRLSTARGKALFKGDERLEEIRNYRKAIDRGLKPKTPGIGVVGEATLRAARGGRF